MAREPTRTENEGQEEARAGYYTVGYEINLKDTEKIYDTIDRLNKTHFEALLADRSVQTSEEINKYNDALNTLGSRVGKIEVPAEYIGRTEETNNIRNITFI